MNKFFRYVLLLSISWCSFAAPEVDSEVMFFNDTDEVITFKINQVLFGEENFYTWDQEIEPQEYMEVSMKSPHRGSVIIRFTDFRYGEGKVVSGMDQVEMICGFSKKIKIEEYGDECQMRVVSNQPMSSKL